MSDFGLVSPTPSAGQDVSGQTHPGDAQRPPEADGRKKPGGGQSLWSDARRDLLGNPVFLASLFIVLVVVSWALFPGLWTDLGKTDCDIKVSKQPPTWLPLDLPPGVERGELAPGHPLGTTVLGCDMYSQIIWGARPSITVALLVTGLVAIVGSTLGILAGYFGGWTDTIISRLTDILLGLPFLLGALVFLALLRSQSIWAVTTVLVVLGWTQLSRIVRGTVLSLRDQDFVDAARAMGATDGRIILRHIVPNALAPVIVLSTLYIGTFISAEATLTFLGVGLKAPEISWGITIADGQNLAVAGFPHLLIFPCVALIVTVLSFILMGDALRDALDPKGRYMVTPDTVQMGGKGEELPASATAKGALKHVSFDESAPLLQVNDLRVDFHTREGVAHAVNGVNFTLQAGRTLGILGESGCGKSVTAQAIMGILDMPPASIAGGQVLLSGVDLLKLPADTRRKVRSDRIGMVFQDALSALNPVFTVGWQLGELFRQHRGFSRSQAKVEAIRLLDMVGIPDASRRVSDFPHQFSGGMRQRVMIAMALALDPDVLIADEPTTALDVTVQAQIMKLLADLQAERNMGLILITHDMGVVADVADDICVMYAGRVVEQADVHSIYSRPAHPYAKALLESIPRVDMKGQDLASIKGLPPNLTQLPPGCSFHPRCRFARDRCLEAEPPLYDVDGGRRSACHYYQEVLDS